MGCFDSLILPCPFCDEDNEEQTKSGPCMLASYRWDDPNLPTWMMQEFDGAEIECYNCSKVFRVRFEFEVVIKDRYIESTNNLDYFVLRHKENEERKEKEG